MFIKRDEFDRKIPVRNLKQFANRFQTGMVDAPIYSIYHFHENNSKLGPSPVDGVVAFITANDDNADGRIYIENVLEFDTTRAKERVVDKTLQGKIDRLYHKAYPQFRKVIRLDRVIDKLNNELVFNYNPLDHVYKWRANNRLNEFNHYVDIFDTIIENVESIRSQRAQIINLPLPRIMMSDLDIKTFLIRPTNDVRREVKSQQMYNILQFYAMVAGMRELPKTDSKHVYFRLTDGLNSIFISTECIREFRETDPVETVAIALVDEIIEAFTSLRVDVLDEAPAETKTEVKGAKVEVKDSKLDERKFFLEKDQQIAVAADEAVAAGIMTEKQRDAQIKLANRYKTIPSPTGEGTVADLLEFSMNTPRTIPPSTVPDLDIVKDKSILSNKVAMMDREYLTKFAEAELVETLMLLQHHEIAILDIKKQHVRDAGSDYFIYKVQTKPVRGKVGTFEFVRMNTDETGVFQYGNVKCRMAKQRFSFPVVKSSPKQVNLTSSMSKFFIEIERNVVSRYSDWLISKIKLAFADGKVEKMVLGGKLDPSLKVSNVESILRTEFKELVIGDFHFNAEREHPFTIKRVAVTVEDESFWNGKESLGVIEDYLGVDASKKPKTFAETELNGVYVPVGMLLSYWLGFKKFLKTIGCTYTEHQPRDRITDPNAIVLKFKDVKVAVTAPTLLQQYMVNGIEHFRNTLKLANFDDLDTKRGYPPVLAGRGIGKSQQEGYRRLKNGWIDAVTYRQLKSRDYPTEMVGLLIKAVDMLTDYSHVNETLATNSYIRGYSRMNDILYRELMKGVAELDRNPSAERTFTINPRAVEQAILSDAAVSPIETSSPFGLLSNQNRIVHSGSGGRSNRTMNAIARQFDKTDVGIVSESGTDDGKSGTVLYYPINPNLKDLYGTPDIEGDKEMGNCFSMQMMCHPFSNRDDMKRTVFLRVQGNSVAPTTANALMPIRSPVDLVVAHSCGGVFTFPTLQPGVVTESNDTFIEVKYKDGTVESMGLGEKISMNSGHMYSRMIVTDRKKGYKFETGEILAWDKYFFERDIIYPTQVANYLGDPTITALRETSATYEDSTSNYSETSKNSVVPIIHARDIKINFDNNVKLLAKLGAHVDSNTVVAYITPPGVEINEDSKSMDYLSMVSPQAESRGEIIRIEVFYNGNLENASQSVKNLINTGNRARKEEARYDKSVFETGEIAKPTYIGKQYLAEDSVVVRVYIRHGDVMTVGDKNSYATALKSVPGKIYRKPVTTMKGTIVGGYFSGMGIFRRVITSAEGVMFGGLYFRQAGLNACKLYRGESLDE